MLTGQRAGADPWHARNGDAIAQQRILADRQTSSTPEEVPSSLALLSCLAERHDRHGIGDVDRLVSLRARRRLKATVEIGDQLLERSSHRGRKAEIGLQVPTRQRPTPYLLALGVVALGVLVTLGPAKETLPFARSESAAQAGNAARNPTRTHAPAPRLGRLAAYMSWHDRSMLAVCQAGFFNKFADSLVAAFFPLYLVRRGVSLAEVGLLVGVYAWAWGLGQVAAGALADRIGRKAPITAVGDTADPAWRGGALGVYRLWRDGGYAVGPLVLGGIAVVGGITAAIWAGVALVGASGVLLLVWLRETEPKRRRQDPAWKEHPEWVAP